MEVEPAANVNANVNANANGTVDNEDIIPKQTLYINNLNERIKKEELKKSLYAMFSQFGTVLDVVALKTLRMRGQAFIAFRDTASATNAMRSMQNFPFYDKPMRIQYAKVKSDAVAKLEGSYNPRQRQLGAAKPKPEKRKAPAGENGADGKQSKEGAAASKKAKKEEQAAAAAAAGASAAAAAAMIPGAPAHLQPKQAPPNKILFVENLPDQTTDVMLQMLFEQYAGFKEVRMVQGKKGIAFVEFENEFAAGAAMTGLQHFKITPTNLMVISYAKK